MGETPLDKTRVEADHPASLRVEQSKVKKKGGLKEGASQTPRCVPFRELFSFADGLDYALMLVGGVAAAVHGGAFPVFFIFLGRLVNQLGLRVLNPGAHEDVSPAVAKYAENFVFLGLILMVSGYFEVSFWMYTGDRQSRRIRTKYLRALISQDVGFFDTDISTGEVVVGISSDTALIQEAIGIKTGSCICYVARFITGFVLAFVSVWKLTLVTFSIMPILVAAGGLCAYIMVGLLSKGQSAYVKAGEIAEEVMAQIRTVQAFVGEEKASKSYSDALLLTKKLGYRGNLVKGLGIGILYGLAFGLFSLLLWYAGKLIRGGTTNGGQAFTTILNVIASSLSLGQAAPDLATFSKAKVSGYTIMEMIKQTPTIGKERDKGTKLAKIEGHVELRDVCFSYPSRPDINVFQNFSLSIPAGKVVAIVGSSGSGKSTVISLIERFYDATSGEVLLDGHNIKSLQLKWLRDQIGLVSQEPALFATSIRENILYGKDVDVSMEEVVQAASFSFAHDFINALPNRYETQVGERGVQLSGGQKQRVAIARAILKNPSILLLDEATSALDAESEKTVQEALDRVMVGRTTVVVAHRLSTIQKADMIAVVQSGRIVEFGAHDELIKKVGGAYASLIKIQEEGTMQGRDCAAASRMLVRLSHGSVSQRTFSFRSNTSSGTHSGQGMRMSGPFPESFGPTPSLKRLLIVNLAEWPYGLLSALGAIVAGAQTPLFALAISQALEYFYSPDYDYMKKGLTKVALLCGASGVISVLAYVCEFYFAGIVGENLTMRVRTMMFSALLRNEIGWFDQNSSSLLASGLATDAALVRAAVADRLVTLFQNLGLIVTAFSIAFSLEWKITLVMIATYPATVVAQILQVLFMKGFGGDLSKAYAKANMVAGEAVSNMRTVAAFCAEEKVMGLFCKELEPPRKQAFVRGQVGGAGYGVSQFCLFSSHALATWYGSILIQKGEADFGQVMKCFMVLVITAFGIAEAVSLAPDLMKGPQTVSAVFQILDRRTEINPDDPHAEEVVEVKGAIEFKHVDFSYPARPDVMIFTDFNLKIRKGHSLALVGASGSGKSSVIGLILRFYDPTFGRVLIDGQDIKSLKLKSLRRHVALVQQEPSLFSTSIYENICYGKENAREAEVIDAAKAANAHNFISGLPDGYRTEVGERGLQMSGGQKQRIAIARAVLKNPAILLLDEATSALDTESEKLVQEALDKLMQRRTTVVVAHRLSTIQNADCIAVLQDGVIAEEGSHHSLLEKKALYFQLLNLDKTPV